MCCFVIIADCATLHAHGATLRRVFPRRMQSIQNLGLAIISIVAGKILDGGGYFMLELFFSACISGKCIYAAADDDKWM